MHRRQRWVGAVIAHDAGSEHAIGAPTPTMIRRDVGAIRVIAHDGGIDGIEIDVVAQRIHRGWFASRPTTGMIIADFATLLGPMLYSPMS